MTAQVMLDNAAGPEFTVGQRCPDCGARYVTGVDAWYRGYAHRLRRLIRTWGWCGTHIDADDIVQDAFVDLAGQLDHVDNPGAWLIKVAKRGVARARLKLDQVAGGDARDHIGASPDRVRWTSLTPLPDVETSLAVRAVLRAMTQLPDRQRVAWYLHRVEGWSHAEIGEHLGCAPATAGVHVHRGQVFIFNTVTGGVAAIGSHNTICVGDCAGAKLVTREASGLLCRAVWVWCVCWPGEPQRWWQVRSADDRPAKPDPSTAIR